MKPEHDSLTVILSALGAVLIAILMGVLLALMAGPACASGAPTADEKLQRIFCEADAGLAATNAQVEAAGQWAAAQSTRTQVYVCPNVIIAESNSR
ncbi:MAG TPA: hypothetical protein VFA39_15815 [Steroidobacteraceae bacterium]|nr:hypothetical protein [Steroidobacteraceae bacterium]